MNGAQAVQLECMLIPYVDGNVIDPDQDVPFAVLGATYGTVYRIVASEIASKSGGPE